MLWRNVTSFSLGTRKGILGILRVNGAICVFGHRVSELCLVHGVRSDAGSVTLSASNFIFIGSTDSSLLTGVRPKGWPHRIRERAPDVGSEAIIVTTNRVGLQGVLASLEAWFEDVVEFLADIDETGAKDMILEGVFLNWVMRQSSGADSFYRSDLDF